MTPPTPRYASISCSADWLDLFWAFAATSRYFGSSSTVTPSADMESVTRSEVLPSSIPDASDILRIDGRAWMDVSTSQPARAMYSRAFADSVAVLDVVFPISIAAFSILA